MPLELTDVVTSNRTMLPLLMEAKYHNPATARMDDQTYMAHVLVQGWCLKPNCPEPPFHCHYPESPIHRELRRLLS